jgi:hypothetical protein
MVEEGIGRAEAELSRPLMLDLNKPYESWSDKYVQRGRLFHKDTMEELNPGTPLLEQPEMLNHRKFRMLIEFRRKDYYIQEGWLYCPRTWKAVKI